MTLNDKEMSALEALTGKTGHIQDLGKDWLLSESIASDGHINDLWVGVFKANGATSGQYNNAAFQFLAGLGFIAKGIMKKWFDYWSAGGGVGVGESFVVLGPDGTEFVVPRTVLDADGNEIEVSGDVLDADGNPINVL